MIPFAQFNTAVPQDVVGRGAVEIKVGQHEMQQIGLSRHCSNEHQCPLSAISGHWWIDDTRRGKPAQARGRLRCFDFALLWLPFPSPSSSPERPWPLAREPSSPRRFLVARLVGGNFRIVDRVPSGRCWKIAPRQSDLGVAFPPGGYQFLPSDRPTKSEDRRRGYARRK